MGYQTKCVGGTQPTLAAIRLPPIRTPLSGSFVEHNFHRRSEVLRTAEEWKLLESAMRMVACGSRKKPVRLKSDHPSTTDSQRDVFLILKQWIGTPSQNNFICPQPENQILVR